MEGTLGRIPRHDTDYFPVLEDLGYLSEGLSTSIQHEVSEMLEREEMKMREKNTRPFPRLEQAGTGKSRGGSVCGVSGSVYWF